MVQLRFRHLTSGTTVIAPGPGLLGTVNVNTAVNASTVTIYNNTSAVAGDIVAIVDGGTVSSKGYFVYCEKGITVVIASGSPDVTIGSQ